MEPPTTFLRKLRILFRRTQFEHELDEELAFHREQVEEELRAGGMSSEDAHYAAVRQVGNDAKLHEQTHDVVGFRLETVLQDLRYGIRQLRKSPTYTATVVVVLALGIGATTAIFSVVNPILFKTLPYPNAKRVTMIWERQQEGLPSFVCFATFHGLSERTRTFDALAAMKPWQPTMVGHTQPERFEGQRVSANYFRVLGIAPAIGRDFEPADDLHKGPRVAILSNTLWRRRFDGDPAIVGKQVTLDGDLFTIVGVMPAAFENVLAPTAELWAPLQYDPSLPPDSREWGHHLRMIGRLRPGTTRQQAQSELDAILRTWG